jgi:hypothetical protein
MKDRTMKKVSKKTSIVWDNDVKKWRAAIQIGATYQFLHYYGCELEAAAAFNEALKRLKARL